MLVLFLEFDCKILEDKWKIIRRFIFFPFSLNSHSLNSRLESLDAVFITSVEKGTKSVEYSFQDEILHDVFLFEAYVTSISKVSLIPIGILSLPIECRELKSYFHFFQCTFEYWFKLWLFSLMWFENCMVVISFLNSYSFLLEDDYIC